MVERQEYQACKAANLENIQSLFHGLNLDDDVIKNRRENLNQCESEFRSAQECLEEAQKKAQEFRTKAAVISGVGTGLFVQPSFVTLVSQSGN